MNTNIIDNIEEAIDKLNQFYDNSVPFIVADDSRIVNPNRVATTLIIPENCFPRSEYWYGSDSWTGSTKDENNNYHYETQISSILRHLFLKAYIENDDMTGARIEFNIVFCPNDPDPKVRELYNLMAYSGQKLVRFLIIGKYCYNANVELLSLDRTKGSRMRAVKMIAHPDLMRHSIFMDFRASEVEFINLLKNYEHISADLIPVIFECCDTCKHIMQRDRS